MKYTIYESAKDKCFFVTTNKTTYRSFCKEVGAIETEIAIKNPTHNLELCSVGNGATDTFRVPKKYAANVAAVKNIVNSIDFIND